MTTVLFNVAQMNKADLIKCSTEKHDILHSQINTSIIAFRHDFLLVLIVRLRRFLWSYFNDKCPERII